MNLWISIIPSLKRRFEIRSVWSPSAAFSSAVNVPEDRTSAALRHPASLEEGLEKRQSIVIFVWIYWYLK